MMKVCGFTIIRNAVKYDFPVVESIQSILPVCDHFIVCIGNSEDATEQLIQSINSPKIQIVHSTWDDSLRVGGQLLAVETNKAFAAIPNDYDWAFYLQADEVIHEKYLETIKNEMQENINNKHVEALLFHYTHFWATYDYVGNSRRWYRREIRIIRNDKSFYSFGDAQGFRKDNNLKLKAKLIDAHVYHYGWVKEPATMKTKKKEVARLWHDDDWVDKKYAGEAEYDYSSIDSLKLFEETHPEVMKERINKKNWTLNLDTSKTKLKLKHRILQMIEKWTGVRLFEYRGYKLLR